MADESTVSVVVAGFFYSTGDFEVGVLGCKGAATDPDSVVCRLDDRFTVVCVEGEFREAEIEGDLLRFSRIQRDPREAFKAADRLFEAGATVAYVALDDLGCGPVAVVFDGCGCSDQLLRIGALRFAKRDGGSGDVDSGEDKVRVGEAVSKRKESVVGDVKILRHETRVLWWRR